MAAVLQLYKCETRKRQRRTQFACFAFCVRQMEISLACLFIRNVERSFMTTTSSPWHGCCTAGRLSV